MSEARLESRLRSQLLQAMADADQAAFHYDQEGMKAMSLINAGKSLAFEQVMAWVVDDREAIAENARLHNEACDSERCEHRVVQNLDAGAECIKCSKDLGWYCQVSPKFYCEYTDDDECCIHCGAPEERQ